MNTFSNSDKQVLLLTDDDDCEALVRMYLERVPAYADRLAEAMHFAGADIVRWPFCDALAPQLEAWKDDGVTARLIVLDTQVRQDECSSTSNGAAAIGALDWIDKNEANIPVLVVAVAQANRVELTAMKQANVQFVSLASNTTEAEAEFVKALAMLRAPKRSSRRLITVAVGESVAQYSINDGFRNPVPLEYPYKRPNVMEGLVRKVNRFSPYSPEHIINITWQEELRELGNELFESLIAETIGPDIIDLLRVRPPKKMVLGAHAETEIRFEISVGAEEKAPLYSLPFELVNPDDKTENFLCTRIPMVRRLRFDDDLDGDGNNELHHPTHPVRILFVDASVGGVVSFTHDRTGEATESESFKKLENTRAEMDAIRRLAKNSGGVMPAPTVLNGGRRLVGDNLLEYLEAELQTGHYDVFHFSGHSKSLKEDGGTFLMFPDEKGRIRSVSMRTVGRWIRGKCPLLVLSSCSGSSLRTAIEAMRKGADAVIGFRWDVNDAVCVDYFKYFYKAYAVDHRSLSQAFKEACSGVEDDAHGTPLWASAIAVVRD